MQIDSYPGHKYLGGTILQSNSTTTETIGSTIGMGIKDTGEITISGDINSSTSWSSKLDGVNVISNMNNPVNVKSTWKATPANSSFPYGQTVNMQPGLRVERKTTGDLKARAKSEYASRSIELKWKKLLITTYWDNYTAISVTSKS